MSFLITAPEALTAAATETRKIRAEAAAVDAAAAPTITAVVAPAPDPDSQRAAEHLVRHALQYSETIAAAAAILEEFALALDAGAAQYAATEADNAKTMG
ncbi:PE family protein [Mycobacterium haemophilum]|uniref:PE family protein n=1 Tax=Mycobacterium haemophilum TaxID=29311 RepID=A0A0I9VFK7_9MYCO|nr:PE family protein [Mycobacterium haemophilum]KLO30719.1 PE family protein [Mycobacterium haemophilum]KLO37762.1 PE family protein [Mycobacterium haemophilum]KLO43158.1 PE family protein [Mycobacterium haemophilum]KLO55584.1 PE family protein [Mycobacterium haemophilum]